jgi:iron(III) transport system substrate-binding protein
LVVYSPHGRDLLTLVEREFEARRPDVDVRWLDMGSQEVYDRVRSERANPQADVWFGGPSTIFARGARDSLLAPFRPAWAEAIAPRGRGPGDLYFAAYETPAVLMYAADALTPDAAPQDWDDLLAPRWRGRVLIRDPLASGTMRAVWGMILAGALEQTGDTAAGMAWLRRLDGQTKEYVSNPALLSEKISRQEGLVTVWDLPDVLLYQAGGLPVGYRFPRSGTVVIEDAIAVVRGSRRAAAGSCLRVVGVVGDSLNQSLDQADVPIAYYSLPDVSRYYSFSSGRFFYLAVHTAGPPSPTLPAGIQQALGAIDPTVPPRTITTMDELVATTTRTARFVAVVVLVFAGIGAVGAMSMATVLGTYLFQVPPRDPVTLGAVLAITMLGALAAAYVPAALASRVDPMEVLKDR